jgi:DNA invertase Pin-like site-specific DNA recombinase
MKKRRCAIYTRKSTEEGLEQSFNSLDAQREVCGSYILSQAHEGWEALPNPYDDGGWSGGNMERPALKQLLADVHAGNVDIIVVYKVDRLTRSLADFARIVDILDHAGASFVSVTQAFNTTNSMGRLTLNVLLSFAQFEREVTSERIRDKIAASKKRGMWMGGPVPLGYRLEGRKLVIEEAEAATVRMLFERYVELRSVSRLVDELAARNIRTKVRQHGNGQIVGGVLFRRGSLSQLLQNPLYMGKVRHRDSLYEGEHDALIEEETWNEVRRILELNRNERRNGSNVRYPSLLTGMLTDPDGRPMTPVFTSRGSKRHHYYVTRLKPGEDPKLAYRVPAGEVDKAISEIVVRQLRSSPGADMDTIEASQAMAEALNVGAVPEKRAILRSLKLLAQVRESTVDITIANCPDAVTRSLPARYVRRGREKRLVLDGSSAKSEPDPVLLRILALATAERHSLLSGTADELTTSFSRRQRRQLLKIAFLAPDIVSAIVEGCQPASMTGKQLLRASDPPLDWGSQRRLLGL